MDDSSETAAVLSPSLALLPPPPSLPPRLSASLWVSVSHGLSLSPSVCPCVGLLALDHAGRPRDPNLLEADSHALVAQLKRHTDDANGVLQCTRTHVAY